MSTYKLYVNSKRVAEWRADGTLPFNQLGGNTSTRKTIHDVELQSGDTLKFEGRPFGTEPAPFDYIEIDPASLIQTVMCPG